MMKSFYHLQLILAALFAVSINSCTSERDPYLRTLSLEADSLEAVDSIDIDRYGLFQPNAVVKADGDWLVLSSAKGDYKLLFVNAVTGDHFFAIRKGRGPGEVIQGGSLHKSGDCAVYYDLNNATCIKIRLDETIRDREIVADTAGIFRGASKPVYMASCGSGFVSGNLTEADVWYSYYDRDGNIISSIIAPELDGLPAGGDNAVSFLISSKYASSPDGEKICVATVGSPSLSFSEVQDGLLSEYRRYVMPPSGLEKGRLTPEHICVFAGMAADDEYVYVIYSGHKIQNDVLPADECRHLIVYSWDGLPVEHYLLDRNINSVYVEGSSLFATSAYPENRLYRFDL